ncbi:MAG: pilus assembly protein PilM [bacterium]|nr:pilus assembly protein PilM [bacterium]
MPIFAAKKKSVLGIDIGASGVKLVELRNEKGRAFLHTYAYIERASGEAEQNALDDPKAASELVQKMMKKAKTTTQRAVAGLPIASVFSSVISVPSGSGKELRQAIEWQAKKLIPLPLEEMVLDWKVLGEEIKKTPTSQGLLHKEAGKSMFSKPVPTGPPELGKKSNRILLTSAARVLRDKYVAFAKATQLELVALETEAFGLIRSLVGKDPSNIMIVDFGAVRTSILIVEKGIPVLTRTITLGGVTITRAIARVLGIPEADAEQMKRDIKQLSAVVGETNGMPGLLAKSLEPLVTEIRFSMNLHRTQQGEGAKPIEKIILSGGSAHLPFLADHLSKELNVNTYVGDPWARVAVHEDLRPILDELGPRFAVAVGLAMRDFE